jgi:hypothetical protein
LWVDVGNIIATDAANILLDNDGAIYAYDDVAHAYVSIASSMHSIAASGTLSFTNQTSTWTDLTIDGSLIVSGATLNATHLTVNADGMIKGIGTVGGPIVNNGTIVTGPSEPNDSTRLVLTGQITGSGTIEIGPAYVTFLADIKPSPPTRWNWAQRRLQTWSSTTVTAPCGWMMWRSLAER